MKLLEELLGVEDADGPMFFLALERLNRLLMSTSHDVLAMRAERILSPVSVERLKIVMEQGRELQARRSTLHSEYDIPAGIDVEELREDSRTIRNSNWLAIFYPSVRAAKGRFRRFLRRPSQSLSKMQIADRLSAIADIITATHACESNGDFRELLGELFRGLETDFELIDRVRSLSMAIIELSNDGPYGLSVSNFLRQSSRAELDRLVRIVRGDKFITLHSMSVARGMSLAQLISEATAKCGALEVIESAWPVDELASMSIGGLRGLIGILEQRVRSNARWRASDDLREVIPNVSEFRISDVQGALAYVDGLRRATSDAGQRQHITTIDSSELIELCRGNRAADSALQETTDYLTALRQAEDLARSEPDHLTNGTVAETVTRISLVRAVADELSDWLQFLRIEERLEKQGLEPFSRRLHAWKGVDVDVACAVEFVMTRSLAAQTQSVSPRLRDATGAVLSGARQRFAQSDREILRKQSARICNDLRRRSVDPGNGSGRASEFTGLALVQREVAKQKRHIALRDLFRRAGAAMQQLMPCFMMSPLSVAQFLERDALTFDLLVIDEASQMRPEDAIGAVSRVKQAIVVGDPKQLPPSSFFSRSDEVDIDNEDSVDTESILELALQQFGRPRRLLWHYRSRHPGLIAFSNHEFYEDELMLFPSPIREGLAGVRLRPVAGIYHSSVNPIEAETVAHAAISFMTEHPDMSLAIVALNQPQKEMIRAFLDKLTASNEAALAYVAKWDASIEPFIVKNLESVQGDERDVVFISTVYGPDERGNVYQRFGPINGIHGWRRLNVLFTRAKHRIDVFTSMRPEQVLADETSGAGVRALRNYLEYAASGRLPSGNATDREPDSDFEISVANVLRAAGFEVVPQVGVSGFFVDMGVVDPSDSTRFIAGIECDGASYHSSRSARDRDRLREDILCKLGWRLLRVWSTDWFTNPRRERQRLVDELKIICASHI